MTRRLLPALVCLGGLALWSCQASALDINCPLTLANRTLADALPSEWRVVPYAERLASTGITSSGALQTLVCDYGQAGAVQKPGPTGYLCRNHPAGFTCTLSVVTDGTPHTAVVDTSPVIHRAGTVRVTNVFPQPVIDLDEGSTFSGVPSPNDLTFSYTPRNGWRFDASGEVWPHFGTSPQGKVGCQSGLKRRLYTLVVPPVGAYTCLRTSDGRISEFKVTAMSSASPQFVTITYTTWPR